jgi:DNA-binding phage protein
MTEREAIKGLHNAAKRRERADKARHVATEDLRRYAQGAKAAGVSMSRIAREAGVSRQGLYDLLADQRPS